MCAGEIVENFNKMYSYQGGVYMHYFIILLFVTAVSFSSACFFMKRLDSRERKISDDMQEEFIRIYQKRKESRKEKYGINQSSDEIN
jgi:hypothetical protein